MVELNTAWFTKYGFTDLSEADEELLADYVETELNMRVGNKLLAKMTDEQMNAFEATTDEDAQMQIIEKAYPGYSDAVDAEFEAMGEELQQIEDKPAFIKKMNES